MKYIELTQGKRAMVDDGDYEWLNQWKWYASKNKHTYYAKHSMRVLGGKQATVSMHRMIMNASRAMQVDHINGNGLDNRRRYLRLCTNQQNSANRGTSGHNKSGLKGVSFCNKYRKWVAVIQNKGKQRFLGQGFCPWKMAGLYDRAAKECFGEFARINGVKCICLCAENHIRNATKKVERNSDES